MCTHVCKLKAQVLWVATFGSWAQNFANMGAHTQFKFLKYPCLGPPSTPSGISCSKRDCAHSWVRACELNKRSGMHVNTKTCMRTHPCTCTHTHMCMHTQEHTCRLTLTLVNTHTHMRIHTLTHIRAQTRTHTLSHTHTHMHAHTHVHAQAKTWTRVNSYMHSKHAHICNGTNTQTYCAHVWYGLCQPF